MAIFNFLKIHNEKVGSEIKFNKYEIITNEKVYFGDFIFPYLRDLETYAEVHDKLWLELATNFGNQKDCNKKDLSNLLQMRGMLMKSITLIEQNYHQFL